MNMEKEFYHSTEEFCDEILDFVNDDCFCGCSIVAKYEVIKSIINQLTTELDIFDMVLIPGEEVFTLYIDPERELSCGFTYEDEWETISEDELCWVHSDVNSGFVKANPQAMLVEFDICDGDCDNCEFSEEDNKDQLVINESPNGLTQSWTNGNSYFSRSFYSSDKDEMEKVKAEWNRFAQLF